MRCTFRDTGSVRRRPDLYSRCSALLRRAGSSGWPWRPAPKSDSSCLADATRQLASLARVLSALKGRVGGGVLSHCLDMFHKQWEQFAAKCSLTQPVHHGNFGQPALTAMLKLKAADLATCPCLSCCATSAAAIEIQPLTLQLADAIFPISKRPATDVHVCLSHVEIERRVQLLMACVRCMVPHKRASISGKPFEHEADSLRVFLRTWLGDKLFHVYCGVVHWLWKRSRSPETDQHRSLSPDPGLAQRRPQGAASRDSISKSPSPSLRRRQSPELRRREHERHHRRDDDPDSRPQEYHRHRDRDEGRPRDRYDDRPHRDDRRDRYQEQDRHSNRRGYEDRRDRYDDRNRDRYVRRSPSRGYERSQYGQEQLPLAPEVGSILSAQYHQVSTLQRMSLAFLEIQATAGSAVNTATGLAALSGSCCIWQACHTCQLHSTLGYLKDGLIHSSQIHEELVLSRDEDDADKIKAMGFYANRDDKVWTRVLGVGEAHIGNTFCIVLVWVKILSVEEGPGGPKVACSMKAVSQEDGRDLDPDNRLASRGGGAPRGAGAGINAGRANLSNEAPPIGSVHKASVMSIKPFGVFVAMEGFRSNGLVHLTQVADHLDINRDDSDDSKVASLGAVVAPGEQIWCKVVEVKEGDERLRGLDSLGAQKMQCLPCSGNAKLVQAVCSTAANAPLQQPSQHPLFEWHSSCFRGDRQLSSQGPRIGCSIKMVSQRDGQDLDPEMTNYFAKGEGGGGGGPRRGGPVGSAVAELKEEIDFTCSRVKSSPRCGSSACSCTTSFLGWTESCGASELPANQGLRNGVSAPADAAWWELVMMSARVLSAKEAQAAMGRGREATKPAWMTNPGASIAPGSAAAPAGPQSELTVQEAMAILAAAKSKHKKSKHKKSKDSHKKKSKKEHKGKSKSKKHRRRPAQAMRVAASAYTSHNILRRSIAVCRRNHLGTFQRSWRRQHAMFSIRNITFKNEFVVDLPLLDNGADRCCGLCTPMSSGRGRCMARWRAVESAVSKLEVWPSVDHLTTGWGRAYLKALLAVVGAELPSTSIPELTKLALRHLQLQTSKAGPLCTAQLLAAPQNLLTRLQSQDPCTG
eukprot:jgi/Astpho2/1351/fgenesh1_pg.00024_%23_38_t